MTIQEFRAIYDSLTAHGWLSIEEALLLVEGAELTTGDMVEIGCYQGRSAQLLANVNSWVNHKGQVQRSPRTLHCVDPWDDHFSTDYTGDEIYLKFRENLKDCPNVVTYRMKVEDWQPVKAGFVYCDGDHTYEGTKAQIVKAFACSPSVIAMHDYVNDGGGKVVVQACTELIPGRPTYQTGRLAVWVL